MSIFKSTSDNTNVRIAGDGSPMLAQPSPKLPGEEIVEGWFAIHGNVDKVSDRGVFGMFAATLAKRRAEGKRWVVVEAHDWSSRGIIGYANSDEVIETRKGLWARVHLLVEDSPAAKFIFTLCRTIPMQASYAYDVISEKKAKDGANELRAVDLLELTICLFGANDETSVAAKQRERIINSPQFKEFVRSKAKRELELLELNVDLLTQDRPNEHDGPVDNSINRRNRTLKYDAVADFDAFARSIGYKTSETDAGARTSEDDVAVVEPWYATQRRCPVCLAWQAESKRPVAPGAAAWEFCTNCGAVTVIASKSWTQSRIDTEAGRILSSISVERWSTREKKWVNDAVEAARNERDLREIKAADCAASKARRNGKRAKVRADVKRLEQFVELNALEAVVKRPPKKSITAEIDALGRFLAGATLPTEKE